MPHFPATNPHQRFFMNLETILIFSLPVTYIIMYIVERLRPAREFPKVPWWGFVGIGFMVLMMTIGVIAPLLFPVGGSRPIGDRRNQAQADRRQHRRIRSRGARDLWYHRAP
jgi:hypothetical protein